MHMRKRCPAWAHPGAYNRSYRRRQQLGRICYTAYMQTTNDTSYGVIPVRREAEGWRIFLIHQYSRHTNDSYWIFPKGHADPGESPADAARRELFEETGLSVLSLDTEHPFTISYTFTHDGVRIEKEVEFYIGVVADPAYTLQVDEVREAGWFSIEEAVARLTHEQPREVLLAAAADLHSLF